MNVKSVPLRPLFPFASPFCFKSLLTPVTSPPAVPLKCPSGFASPPLVSASIASQAARAEPSRIRTHPPLPILLHRAFSDPWNVALVLSFILTFLFLKLTRGLSGLQFHHRPSGSRTYTGSLHLHGGFVQSMFVLSLERPLPLNRHRLPTILQDQTFHTVSGNHQVRNIKGPSSKTLFVSLLVFCQGAAPGKLQRERGTSCGENFSSDYQMDPHLAAPQPCSTVTYVSNVFSAWPTFTALKV